MSAEKSNKPEIKPDGYASQTKALPLIKAITWASSELDKLKAWPEHGFAPYDIRIVAGNRIETKFHGVPSSKPGRTMAIAKNNPLRIEVGVDIFVSGVGDKLQQASQMSRDIVMFNLLAHEIFHLTELDRMSLSRVPHELRQCTLATGIRPDFDPTWRAAVIRLAEDFPTKRSADSDPQLQRQLDLEYWKAADIASEACADVLSLRLLSQIEPNWLQMANAVRDMRIAEEKAAVAAGPSLCPGYQIGMALANMIPMLEADPGLTEQAIHIETWEMALNVLVAKGNLSAEGQELLNALPNPLSHAPPSKTKPKGLF